MRKSERRKHTEEANRGRKRTTSANCCAVFSVLLCFQGLGFLFSLCWKPFSLLSAQACTLAALASKPSLHSCAKGSAGQTGMNMNACVGRSRPLWGTALSWTTHRLTAYGHGNHIQKPYEVGTIHSPRETLLNEHDLRTLPRATGVSEGPRSQKSLKKVSRGLRPRQKVWKKSRKSPEQTFSRLFLDFSDFFETFPDFLGPWGRRPRETFL